MIFSILQEIRDKNGSLKFLNLAMPWDGQVQQVAEKVENLLKKLGRVTFKQLTISVLAGGKTYELRQT